MKRQALTLFLLITSITAFSQKVYVWCPTNFDIKPRIGLYKNDTISVVIFDGRVIPKQKKIACTSEQFVTTLVSQIKLAYPSAYINQLPEDDYYKKYDPKSSILIKIGISAYHAGFGTDISTGIGLINGQVSTMIFPKGQWNALTSYTIQIYKGTHTDEKEISNLSSKPNTFGYSSAKKALNETYNKSNQELLFFIDKNLQK